MRAVGVLMGVLAAASSVCGAAPLAQEDARTLVREVVYNEQHDHDIHGYWRYWVQKHGQAGTQIEEQVETAEGTVSRVLIHNGQRLDAQSEQVEDDKLRALMNSPGQQANLRQAYREDEDKIGRILVLLPDAFDFTDAGMEGGMRHLRYTPNAKYTAHGMEAKVFHQLSGDLWIDVRMKRLKRLEGHLSDDVNFGFGVLGRVNKGSWFRMARTQVNSDEWKTDQLSVHISGRALMMKTIGHDTDEVRGGFETVPAAMSMTQGLRMLQVSPEREAALAVSVFSPAALLRGRGAARP
ncbi:MAG TPA: hypothetical protein VGJ21_09490 [Terracidiphilus sp.]